jgi:hypothetical protein
VLLVQVLLAQVLLAQVLLAQVLLARALGDETVDDSSETGPLFGAGFFVFFDATRWHFPSEKAIVPAGPRRPGLSSRN